MKPLSLNSQEKIISNFSLIFFHRFFRILSVWELFLNIPVYWTCSFITIRRAKKYLKLFLILKKTNQHQKKCYNFQPAEFWPISKAWLYEQADICVKVNMYLIFRLPAQLFATRSQKMKNPPFPTPLSSRWSLKYLSI